MDALTREVDNAYTFEDLVPNADGYGRVLCAPETPPQRIELLAPKAAPMRAGEYNADLHSAAFVEIFGETVLWLPPSGVRIWYFTPMTGINLYLGSDVFMDPKTQRVTEYRVYAENGDYLGGDAAHTPFGPIDAMPDEQRSEWQYMVWHMPPQTKEPGDRYYNPLHGRPCAYADVFPGADNVYMGKVKAD